MIIPETPRSPAKRRSAKKRASERAEGVTIVTQPRQRTVRLRCERLATLVHSVFLFLHNIICPDAGPVIFDTARDLPAPTERSAYLDRECGEDKELRQRLDELLAAHDQPASELDHSLAALIGTGDYTDQSAASAEAPDSPVERTASLVSESGSTNVSLVLGVNCDFVDARVETGSNSWMTSPLPLVAPKRTTGVAGPGLYSNEAESSDVGGDDTIVLGR